MEISAVLVLLVLTAGITLCVSSLVRGRRLAVAVRSRQRAESSDRAKSAFLAHVSHEIRTPLNVLIGMTDILLDTELDEEQRGLAGRVRRSSEMLLTLVNDVLDLSKIEAGRMDIEAISFDLRAMLREIVGLHRVGASEKGLELDLRVDPRLPIRVVGDPVRCRQVLVNLISNAIKFTERGRAAVDLRVEDASDEGVTVRFAVTDTGIGIGSEDLPRLFEPFVQADPSMARRYGGTGLGLSIVHRLVSLMGGDLCVESTPGRGSQFAFTLRFPIRESVPGEAPARAA
jgi:two-component system, sensor histidine kinase and response regulator